MAWIESHQTLREHPKTKRLCRLLSINRREAVGLLQFLWWWALDFAPEGDLVGVADEDIADAVDWGGDAGRFVDALTQAGFVDEGRQIHDWDEYAEKWIARRRANAERMRVARATRKSSTSDVRGDDVQDTCVARAGATGPDRTGPDLPDLTGPGLRLVALEDSADEPPTTMKAGPAQAQLLRKLSPEARGVIDYHRQCHGGRRSVRLTPVSVEVLEEAVADLGAERIKEGIRHMAGKMPPVTELSKGISAARTKRASDEAAAEPARVLPKVVGGSAHAAPPRRQISDDARRLLESDDPEWGRDR
jgi:hypothetical protein